MKTIFVIASVVKQFGEVKEKYELEIRKRIKHLINMDRLMRMNINDTDNK